MNKFDPVLLKSLHFKQMVEGASLLLEGLANITNNKGVPSFDKTDDNFKKTPYRIAKSYLEMCIGLSKKEEIQEILDTGFPSNYNGMIIIDNVSANSMCPHHFLPVKYKVDFAYIPSKKMLGLSKIPRIIKLLAMQPMLQEDYTQEILKCFNEYVKPNGAAVIVTGVHTCMQCRGVEVSDSPVITSELLGVFKEQDVKSEFIELLKLRRH